MAGKERWAAAEPGTRKAVLSPAETSGVIPLLWTVDDLCRFLGVSRRWVHERTRHGEIPCYRFGSLLRFDPEEVQAWAANFHRSAGDTAGRGRPR